MRWRIDRCHVGDERTVSPVEPRRISSATGPDLLGRLGAWAGRRPRADEAGGGRAPGSVGCAAAAGEEATFAGVLLDLAERGAPVRRRRRRRAPPPRRRCGPSAPTSSRCARAEGARRAPRLPPASRRCGPRPGPRRRRRPAGAPSTVGLAEALAVARRGPAPGARRDRGRRRRAASPASCARVGRDVLVAAARRRRPADRPTCPIAAVAEVAPGAEPAGELTRRRGRRARGRGARGCRARSAGRSMNAVDLVLLQPDDPAEAVRRRSRPGR